MRRVELSARVSERIDRVHVREGDRVKAGQALVELDHRSQELALREAQVILDNAKVDARVQLLNDSEVTPEKEALVANRSGLTAAQQSVARAELNLEGTRITAPFAAYVVEVTAVLGGIAQRRSRRSSPSWISPPFAYHAEVLESAFGTLEPGIRAQVRFAALPGEIFEGTVAALSPEVDPSRGTGVAYIELSNPDGRIKPGMYAEVRTLRSYLPGPAGRSPGCAPGAGPSAPGVRGQERPRRVAVRGDRSRDRRVRGDHIRRRARRHHSRGRPPHSGPPPPPVRVSLKP